MRRSQWPPTGNSVYDWHWKIKERVLHSNEFNKYSTDSSRTRFPFKHDSTLNTTIKKKYKILVPNAFKSPAQLPNCNTSPSFPYQTKIWNIYINSWVDILRPLFSHGYRLTSAVNLQIWIVKQRQLEPPSFISRGGRSRLEWFTSLDAFMSSEIIMNIHGSSSNYFFFLSEIPRISRENLSCHVHLEWGRGKKRGSNSKRDNFFSSF